MSAGVWYLWHYPRPLVSVECRMAQLLLTSSAPVHYIIHPFSECATASVWFIHYSVTRHVAAKLVKACYYAFKPITVNRTKRGVSLSRRQLSWQRDVVRLNRMHETRTFATDDPVAWCLFASLFVCHEPEPCQKNGCTDRGPVSSGDRLPGAPETLH